MEERGGLNFSNDSQRTKLISFDLPRSWGSYVITERGYLNKMMNNRGNIMMNLMFFIMALGVMIAFISPINSFLDLAQQSDALNCKGFVFNGNTNHTLSFNATLDGGSSGNPLACIALKLYLPYILLIFLVGGLSLVLANKASSLFGQEQTSDASPY